MPRAESKTKGMQGEFDRSALPDGILPTTVTGVTIVEDEADFPDFKKNKEITYVFTFMLLAQGHKYESPMSFDIRLKMDPDMTLRVDDPLGTPQDERVNIQILHNFLDAIGYGGGFNISGEWVNPQNVQIPSNEIEAELTNHITKMPAEAILVFFKKTEKADGKIWFNAANYCVSKNTSEGSRYMNRKFKKSGKKTAVDATGSSVSVAGQIKPTASKLKTF